MERPSPGDKQLFSRGCCAVRRCFSPMRILQLTPPLRGWTLPQEKPSQSNRLLQLTPRVGANWSRVNAIRNATSTHTPLCGGVNTASGRVQAPGSLTHARDGANIKCLNICRQFLWHYNSRPREGGELRNRSSKRYLNSRPRVGANVPHCNQSGAFGAATHAPPWSE